MMRILVRLRAQRSALLGATVALPLALALLLAGSASSRVLARPARTERLMVDAHLHYVNARGSYLIEEGRASGPLAGLVKAQIKITATIAGSFTFYPRDGSISGSGSGKLHESGTYASFGGTVTVLGGTGRYAHARGGGGLYGVYDRKTLGVEIQTTGTLSY
ncbi:MAG TPA: hypothetical protein VMD79_00275 [Solirubrobacteraceae bacterium]|nr:hypothetical protein [Solirubrobacteraceae bacterium]